MAFFIQCVKIIGHKAAQAVGVQHIEIAGIYAAVGFHGVLHAAAAHHAAAFGRAAQQHAQVVFKLADVDEPSLHHILGPAIKQAAQKLRVLVHCQPALIFAEGIQAGNVLLPAQIMPGKEIIYQVELVRRIVGDNGEHIKGDVVAAQQLGGIQHPAQRALAARVGAIFIVQACHAIQR